MSRPRYYTPKEVAAHNTPGDCWVSYLGNVYDLTSLCKEFTGEHGKLYKCYTMLRNIITIMVILFLLGDVLLKPIVANAGKDISHWFDPDTKDVSRSSVLLVYT